MNDKNGMSTNYNIDEADVDDSEDTQETDTTSEDDEEKPRKYYIGDGESENDSDYDYIPTDKSDYGLDPNYTGELGPQQPYVGADGRGYTPPGFVRRYIYRKIPKANSVPKELNVLFEL